MREMINLVLGILMLGLIMGMYLSPRDSSNVVLIFTPPGPSTQVGPPENNDIGGGACKVREPPLCVVWGPVHKKLLKDYPEEGFGKMLPVDSFMAANGRGIHLEEDDPWTEEELYILGTHWRIYLSYSSVEDKWIAYVEGIHPPEVIEGESYYDVVEKLRHHIFDQFDAYPEETEGC